MEYFSIDGLEDDVKSTIDNANNQLLSQTEETCVCPNQNGNNTIYGEEEETNIDDNNNTGGDNLFSSNSPISINHVNFDTCQNKKGHCISDIYTYDDFGLPISQNVDPVNSINLLYAEDETYIPKPSEKYLKKTNAKCSERTNGCCADGISYANKNGRRCDAFDAQSGLTGSPISNWNNNALGGTNKRLFIDESSGNSYMPYINSNIEGFNNINSTQNICNITKYAILICIILIIGLIIGVYVNR